MSVDHPILSVTELTHRIKKTLENRFQTVQVKGEVSNLRAQASGHTYFTLKDQGAQLSAVLFKGDARRLQGNPPRDGDEVIATGELSIYAPRGNYQLIVRHLEQAGLGKLLLKLHALKKKLGDRGYFDSQKKRPLPKYPHTIGVVTSPTGAVIRDIVNVLNRRFKPFRLILNPVRVQGEEAADEIARAIEDFNRFSLADLLIVGRGGGSLEDLWPFNDERVARAIFESTIPIISAVGHETDVSISDLVADVRAPTPSAAAEIAVRDYATQEKFLKEVRMRATHHLKQVIARCHAELKGIKRHPLFTSSIPLLSTRWQKLDEALDKLEQVSQSTMTNRAAKLKAASHSLKVLQPSRQIKEKQRQLFFFSKKLDQIWEGRYAHLKEKMAIQGSSHALLKRVTHHIHSKKERLTRLTSHLQSIDPKALLKKGYCIPFAEKEHSVIMTVQALKEKSRFSLLFHDGNALVTTEEINPNV